MIKFKDCLSHYYEKDLVEPMIKVHHPKYSLSLKFDSKDVVIGASYSGSKSIWMASLCQMVTGKNITELREFNFQTWEESFKDDQTFWDLQADMRNDCFSEPLELLWAGVSLHRGRDYLYRDMDPLICRCFGVREKDILHYLNNTESPELSALSLATKAGMGCRSCIPQIKRWVAGKDAKKHFYKDKAVSEWIIEIDSALQDFPQTSEWKLEVASFKGNQVIISYDKDASQVEQEKLALNLQGFLGSVVDAELGFFLIRSRQF